MVRRMCLLSLGMVWLALWGASAQGLLSHQAGDKLRKDGNFREALDVFRMRLESPDNAEPAEDLTAALHCLQQLGEYGEVDGLLEQAVALHGEDWRLLGAASQGIGGLPSYGVVQDGEWSRGPHRGAAAYLNSAERDRVRALQWIDRGLDALDAEARGEEVADFFYGAARLLVNGRASWQWQILTNLEVLPDLEAGRFGSRDPFGTDHRGAPVDEEGKPVFFGLPETWEGARNDGARWRYLLQRAAAADPDRAGDAAYRYASFLQQQFGVETLQQGFGHWFSRQAQNEAVDQQTVWSLHTLEENETLCRLATGVKRLVLPDDANPLKWMKRIAEEPAWSSQSEAAGDQVARMHENRRQYERAATAWRQAIARHGEGRDDWRRRRVEEIEEGRLVFEETPSFVAGEAATLSMVFRNATEVSFRAYEVKLEPLLASVKQFLEGNPSDVYREEIRLPNIGAQLIREGWMKYVGKEVARWEQALEPLPNHWDRRVEVRTPLTQAGAYMVRATLPNGRESNLVVWLHDTVMVKKPLQGQTLYYVADAISGQPVAKAHVEFFGWRRERLEKQGRLQRLFNRRSHNVITKHFAEYADDQGLVTLSKDQAKDYQWLAIARTEAGRLAYHGFSGTWRERHDAEYKATKAFFVTDRPVYRPGHEVKMHGWIRHAQYDQKDVSQFAHQPFQLILRDPRGEKLIDREVETDAYGGISAVFTLPEDAALGVYTWQLDGLRNFGGQQFRVEAYKKPEFEVEVEGPAEGVALGERVEATIKARYYFGSPVTEATVKYKVWRTPHEEKWYAPRPWDWLYGPGYWWFAQDYEWYPGWAEWGCPGPRFPWQPQMSTPPELVQEREVAIGPDGTVPVVFDTALTKAIHGDTDHRYEISVEVRDASRRTVVGQGTVSVARHPFRVNVWVDRGHYQVGETIEASACARSMDGQAVRGQGRFSLLKIRYEGDREPKEEVVGHWEATTDGAGCARQKITAAAPGQYRLRFVLTDAQGREREGAQVFVVRGQGFDGNDYRFNDLEVTANAAEYREGETAELLVTTEQAGAAVLWFVRPSNGTYLPPRVIEKVGKSVVESVPITAKDLPNFFVEAVTVSRGMVHTVVKEIVVPPARRVAHVEVEPERESVKPGEAAVVSLRLRDHRGEPFRGSAVVAVYDKAVDYFADPGQRPDMRAFFWKWRRHHHPQHENNVSLRFYPGVRPRKEGGMSRLGLFGGALLPGFAANVGRGGGALGAVGGVMEEAATDAAPAPRAMTAGLRSESAVLEVKAGSEGGEMPVQVRKEFADTALWLSALEPDDEGRLQVEVPMPENLTTWKIKVWSMGHGTVVGEGEAEVVTRKDLILRQQAPRFFVEGDEVWLSANVHNYLEGDREISVSLALEGNALEVVEASRATQTVTIPAEGEARVDWQVRAAREGEAAVTMAALTEGDSDAVEMRYPVKVHGAPIRESWSGVLRPLETTGEVVIDVPEKRREESTLLTIRYSPSVAAAIVDALPYLVSYPYGCTEQTLNRFLPTLVTQRVLDEMGVDLESIRDHAANLNPQELEGPQEVARRWQPRAESPVFDSDEVGRLVKEGLMALTSMQNRDGGWGWFSGERERSEAHTTAWVVRGLQLAKANGAALVPEVLERGQAWLRRYQKDQTRKLLRWDEGKRERDAKSQAEALDALVYLVLAEAGEDSESMRGYLYRDRNELPVYAKAMLGVAMHHLQQFDARDMLLRNVEQFLKRDAENQTAFLELGNGAYWWRWYGSEFEAHAFTLKLLALAKPDSEEARGVVKYLLNQRKRGSRWNSTRDTALCVEAIADYLLASSEAKETSEIEVWVNGERLQRVTITPESLFATEGTVTLAGEAIGAGRHVVSLRKKGGQPLYYQVYLDYFSLEESIAAAGLEVRAQRRFSRLMPLSSSVEVSGSRGQLVSQAVEKWKREPITAESELNAGDLIEVELLLESKNDYEYLLIKDPKPAGLEPVEVRSGYRVDGLRVYQELRDDHVAFFARSLPRGRHALKYRMRAEVPGRFSALPTSIVGMYAPELAGNSDEDVLTIAR